MYQLDIERLASLVRKKRGNRGLRETSAEIGNVSPSTLSRVESGKMPDMETFLALCNWLEVPLAELFRTTEEKQLNACDAIIIQLQGDPNLDPAMPAAGCAYANALVFLIKAAYSELAKTKHG